MAKKQLNILFMSFSVIAFLFISGILSCSDAVKPDVYSVKVGKVDVLSLQDAAFDMKAELVKNGDPDEIKRLMPEGKLPASVNVFIIKTGSKNILVDTGIGNGKAGKGMMLESMKKAELSPEDISVVFITHAHFDHVGGLVNDGKPVFINAKLIFSNKEADAISDAAIKKLPADVKSYFEPANVAYKIYGKNTGTVKAGDMISDGVKVVELSGHTSGHAGLLIESQNEKLLMFGDLLHITGVQFQHPDYSLVYDSDIKKAAERRNKTLDMAVSEKMFVAGVHIKFPGIGRVSKSGTGYTFLPVE